jgi:hypothetical protein
MYAWKGVGPFCMQVTVSSFQLLASSYSLCSTILVVVGAGGITEEGHV